MELQEVEPMLEAGISTSFVTKILIGPARIIQRFYSFFELGREINNSGKVIFFSCSALLKMPSRTIS